MRRIASALLLLAGVLSGCTAVHPVKPGSPPDAANAAEVPALATGGCAVTQANGSTPPGEQPSAHYHGDGQLWTALWPQGTVTVQPDQVMADGRLGMKFPWWRGVVGELSISGRRLDAPAPPLEALVNDGYGARGFQASGIIFPSAGCWEVTGRVGEHTLTFITRVQLAES